MEVTPDPIWRELNETHPANAEVPIEPEAISTEVKLLQLTNANLPIEAAPYSITTDAKLLQHAKASEPIDEIPEPIVTDVTPEQE